MCEDEDVASVVGEDWRVVTGGRRSRGNGARVDEGDRRRGDEVWGQGYVCFHETSGRAHTSYNYRYY